MFGKNRVLSEGTQASGVVFATIPPAATAGGGHTDTYHVTVRVKFDDGSTKDVKQKLHISKAGRHLVGDVLPVRYDPDDHSKLEIDLPALIARRKADLDGSEQQSRARAEAVSNELPASGPSATQILGRVGEDPSPTADQTRDTRSQPS